VVIAANGSMTTAFTTNVPVEQFGGNASTGAGNYTFNIQAMQMQAGNGNAAAQTYTVFVGEANCNANAVVSTVSYQALARFDSGLVSTLPGTSNNAVQNHNIGTKNLEGYLYVENINSEIGYSVGDRVAFTIGSSGSSGVPNATWWNRLAVGWSTDNGNALRVVPRSGGSDQAVTQANWKYGFFMHRNY
jgi:predicted RNA-binding protein with TRAM domain